MQVSKGRKENTSMGGKSEAARVRAGKGEKRGPILFKRAAEPKSGETKRDLPSSRELGAFKQSTETMGDIRIKNRKKSP